MAPQIVRHAILMVLNNFPNALKATIGPAVIAGLAITLLGAALGVGPSEVARLGGVDPNGIPVIPTNPGALSLFLLGAIVIVAIAMSWAAVAWHRYILLEEYPGVLPAFNDRPILSYIGKTIVLTFLILMVMLPVMLLLSGVFVALAQGGGFVAGSMISALLGILISYFWLRWALVLPSAAVNEPMGVGASWGKTGPHTRTILGVAALLMLLNLVLGLLALPFGASIVAIVISYAVNWFTLMVGLSVLTTLYGHIVQGRELAE